MSKAVFLTEPQVSLFDQSLRFPTHVCTIRLTKRWAWGGAGLLLFALAGLWLTVKSDAVEGEAVLPCRPTPLPCAST